MNNVISFGSVFLSYFLVFVVFIAAIVIAVVLGTTFRRIMNNKNGKKTEKADSNQIQ